MGSLRGFYLEGEIKSITFEFRNNDFGHGKENGLRMNGIFVDGV